MTERKHEDTSQDEGQRPNERQQKDKGRRPTRGKVKHTTTRSHFPLR